MVAFAGAAGVLLLSFLHAITKSATGYTSEHKDTDLSPPHSEVTRGVPQSLTARRTSSELVLGLAGRPRWCPLQGCIPSSTMGC
jgi:hypothetical protein